MACSPCLSWCTAEKTECRTYIHFLKLLSSRSGTHPPFTFHWQEQIIWPHPTARLCAQEKKEPYFFATIGLPEKSREERQETIMNITGWGTQQFSGSKFLPTWGLASYVCISLYILGPHNISTFGLKVIWSNFLPPKTHVYHSVSCFSPHLMLSHKHFLSGCRGCFVINHHFNGLTVFFWVHVPLI